ncbi:MAG: hypothetical protein LKI26_05865 [Bifidobacterium tibiigranuli]|nr:hypothetical protein [Bifidobacterium tibiigranuli]
MPYDLHGSATVSPRPQLAATQSADTVDSADATDALAACQRDDGEQAACGGLKGFARILAEAYGVECGQLGTGDLGIAVEQDSQHGTAMRRKRAGGEWCVCCNRKCAQVGSGVGRRTIRLRSRDPEPDAPPAASSSPEKRTTSPRAGRYDAPLMVSSNPDPAMGMSQRSTPGSGENGVGSPTSAMLTRHAKVSKSALSGAMSTVRVTPSPFFQRDCA